MKGRDKPEWRHTSHNFCGIVYLMFILFELFKGSAFTQKVHIMSKMLRNAGGYQVDIKDILNSNSGISSCIMQTAADTLPMSIYVKPKLDDTAEKKNAN